MSDSGTTGSTAPEPGIGPATPPGTEPVPAPGTEPTATMPAQPLPGTEPTATMPAVPPVPPPAAVPPPPPPPPGTKIQQVQGEGAWRRWMLVTIVVLALVVVGLALWAADRQTPDDEGDTGGETATSVAEGTTTVAETTVAPTTAAPTTAAPTTAAPTTPAPTTAAPTTAAPTTAAPTTAPPTTQPGDPTTSSPATTVAPEFEGVLADLAELPDYSTLTSLLAAAGIFELDEPVTIFAPTDEAFAALPADTVDYLTDPANVGVLREVLTNHVVAGALLASDLPTGTTLTTLAGQEIEVTSQGGRLLVGGVPVVDADIEAGDGSVIHGIDGVLVPTDVDLPELTVTDPSTGAVAGPPPVLRLAGDVHGAMVAHAYAGLPLEACGLVAGDPARATATAWYPCRNLAASSRVYTLDPGDHLRAELDAERRGLEIVGVVHSHTHTEPYPSPTDIAQAPDPSWHYVIVGLKREVPSVRSWRIVDGQVTEETVVLDP